MLATKKETARSIDTTRTGPGVWAVPLLVKTTGSSPKFTGIYDALDDFIISLHTFFDTCGHGDFAVHCAGAWAQIELGWRITPSVTRLSTDVVTSSFAFFILE